MIWPDTIQTRPVRTLYRTAVVFHLMWWVCFPNHVCPLDASAGHSCCTERSVSPHSTVCCTICSLYRVCLSFSLNYPECNLRQKYAKVFLQLGCSCLWLQCHVQCLVCHVLLSVGLTDKFSLHIGLYRVKASHCTVVLLSRGFMFGVIVRECILA